MTELFFGVVSAFWLGILTSISPCPLATNITAISFVGRKIASPSKVFLTGMLYTLGRSLTYIAIAMLLVWSLLSSAGLSHILQKYMNKALGPMLILVGMILLELIQIRLGGAGISEKAQRRVEAMGLAGAFLLGIVFALSFCPVSAAFFFGSLIPVAVKCRSGVLLPLAYGIGTGFPVLIFSVLIAFGAKQVGRAYNKLVLFEKWARGITGVLFILAGIYYCLIFIFGIPL